jgi:FAD/FMN-containing dehydrogenase/Fe-S oxidoreductase
MIKPDTLDLFSSLRQKISGDVLTDELNRMLYSSDASIYQQLPQAVVRPRHRDDCIELVKFAREHKISLIPRAAGTSLAGQVVGESVIVDTSRYMNNIVDVDVKNKTARVQPGVVLDILNQQIRQYGLQFAPNPSTANRCTISGMIGNNAWGAHYPAFGSTRDHVLTVDAILSDASYVQINPCTAGELEKHISENSLYGKICQFLKSSIETHRKSIISAYPALNELPCNMGYPFHVLAQQQPWNPSGESFNISKLLCGSEGTLALITEATLQLVPIPKHRHMVCCHFDSLEQALQAVEYAVSRKASAVELLDDHILSLTKNNLEQRRNRKWIEGEPKSVLLVEFCGKHASALENSIESLIKVLGEKELGYHFTRLINEQTDAAWSIRKAGLGLLMGTTDNAKPVTFIEDSAVPVKSLPGFVSEFKKIVASHNTTSVYYGSVSSGLIHLRPILNLKLHKDKLKLIAIADETADLLNQYNGTMTAKHGDGKIRGKYISQMLGDEVYQLTVQTKNLFDPNNIFNPHTILDSPPIGNHLRTDSSFTDPTPKTYLDWSDANGFISAIERCNGAGACRKSAGNGLMCPSYMVTLEEQHSTRGRANVIRQSIEKYGFEKGITHQNVKDVLKLCLSCKGCSSECPANVDMTRLKIEHLQQHLKHHRTPLRTHAIRHYETLSKLASYIPPLANFFMNSQLVRSLLGYDARRKLPAVQNQTLSQWFESHQPHANSGKQGDVVILNNVFSEYYDVKIGKAAIEFLEYCGYRVELSPCFPSLRTILSQGLVEVARERLSDIFDYTYPKATFNIPMIGLEPSELLVLRDDAKSLVTGEQISRLAKVSRQVFLFEEFISDERYKIESLELDWKAKHITILLHVHCHQKSLTGLEACRDALSIIPECGIEVIPAGCCGMAGSFGYEKENYNFSQKVGNLILFPALRNASKDTIIVATGTSCRHQIRGNIDREPLHPAEVLRQSLVLQ